MTRLRAVKRIVVSVSLRSYISFYENFDDLLELAKEVSVSLRSYISFYEPETYADLYIELFPSPCGVI